MGPNKHTYYLSEETAAKLIKEVKSRTLLWDQEDENYTSRFLTARAWKEVATNVGLKENLLRAKWKNLRDLFKKEVRKFKTTSLGSYKGRWRYFEPLYFLRKLCESEFGDDDNRDDLNSQDGEDDFGNAEYLEDSNQESDVVVDSGNLDVGVEHFFKVEPNEIDLQEDPISEKTPYTDDDYDLMFLKSLMPYFRQLDSMRKLVLRSKIQDMLMNEIAAQTSLNSKK